MASSEIHIKPGNDCANPELWRQIEDGCATFLQRNCISQFIEVLTDQGSDAHYPILVDYLLLFGDAPLIGQALLRSPLRLLTTFDSAARLVLIEKNKELRDNPTSHTTSLCLPPDISLSKLNLHVRIHSLPICNSLTRSAFPSCKESGEFLCLFGSVVRVSSSKVLEYAKSYQCSRCKEIVSILAPASRYHGFPRFAECQNLCNNAKVAPIDDKDTAVSSKFRDYQEIKLQEQIHKMDFGAMPKVITVILEDDLVSSCKPGDDVAITGYLYLRWKPFKVGLPAESQLVLNANHVQVNNDQRACLMISEDMTAFITSFWDYYKDNPFEGRNVIISSFCPQIYGMYIVKLGLCMVLAGGVTRQVSGNRLRGECHMLMVGDPGTGKSQLLKYASKISPRSVLTTGIGTSSAGLTVSATKDNGEWHLEAGALLLADGGVCCIDEFSCIKEHDRTSIHEAMEQQTISIAKAGMVVKLPTRVTIIAATNPKGKYDPEQPVSINVGIASPLLSRFDVVMVLSDAQNDEWDSFISDFILEGKEKFNDAIRRVDSNDIWDMDRLQTYLVMIKDVEPTLGPEANELIRKYYQYQRSLENRNVARTTVRLLESLRRLSEGHARLMFRSHVLLHDVITAIALLEASMQSSSIVEAINGMHTAFPADPMEEYRQQAHIILTKLDLHHLWEAERAILDDLKIKKAIKKNGFSMSQRPSTSASTRPPPTLPVASCSKSQQKPNVNLSIRDHQENQEPHCQQQSRIDDDCNVVPNLNEKRSPHSSSSSPDSFAVTFNKELSILVEQTRRNSAYNTGDDAHLDNEDGEHNKNSTIYAQESIRRIYSTINNSDINTHPPEAVLSNTPVPLIPRTRVANKLNRFKRTRPTDEDSES